MPILNKGIIYNDGDVEHSGWSDDVNGEFVLKDGWTTRSGKFIRFDQGGSPVRRGDRTVASLMAPVHYDLGQGFNRFFSYVGSIMRSHLNTTDSSPGWTMLRIYVPLTIDTEGS
jgi:hypothetical protein